MATGRRRRWIWWGGAIWALAALGAVVVLIAGLREAPGTGAAWGQATGAPGAPDHGSAARGRAEVQVPAPEPDVLEMPPLVRWRTFSLADGLPAEKVFCVRADGRRLWAGTEAGLACYEDGRWRSWGPEEGLPHAVVLALDVSQRTGDLWIGTMGGLARLSGGRIDTFTQLSSGLSNDFVHDVECDSADDHVWAASAMGASRLDLRTGEWTIFSEENTPMREPWTYSVAIERGLVYVGAWGAGILEYDKQTGRWREYRDPDKEMEIDLLPDDGPVHDVTASVDFKDGVLWQATYFGLARYDGRSWRTYFPEDSGLASAFVQFVRARGRVAWCCTDRGLSATDGSRWVTYRRRDDGKGEVFFHRGKEPAGGLVTEGAMANNFVLGVDFVSDGVWVATDKGVSHGEPDPSLPGTPARGEPEAAASPPPPGRAAGPELAGRPAAPPAGGAEAPGARFRYARTPVELLPYRNLEIYHQFFTTPPEFHGAGREKPEPEVDEVRIGFIAPLEDEDRPTLPPGFRSGLRGDPRAGLYGRPMLRAAQLAIEDANRAGGYRGKPFRLILRTDLVQWGQTSNELVQFAYTDGVWAIVSGVDSNHQHVLARATLKAQVPIVNAGSTDPTLLEHAIPWIVRVMSDDRQNAYLLLEYMLHARRLSRLAVLRVNDRDGRVGIAELEQGARRLGCPIVIELRFRNGDRDFSAQLETIARTGADALYLLGNPVELGLIVKAVRERGLPVALFAGDRATHPKFLETAGPAAEGLVAVSTFNPESEESAWQEFRRRYVERFGEPPNAFSAHAYDGVNLIVEAIRAAGLNRDRIRDALFARKSFAGVSGTIEFDSTLNNVRRPYLAEVRGGRFHYFTPPRAGEGAR